jgi:uncharacterized protein YlxP (DUF503 family)
VLVLAAEVDLEVLGSRSLKDKRRVRQSLLERLWAMHLAASEVALQDNVRRLRLGIAAVSGDPARLEAVWQAVERLLFSVEGVTVLQLNRETR